MIEGYKEGIDETKDFFPRNLIFRGYKDTLLIKPVVFELVRMRQDFDFKCFVRHDSTNKGSDFRALTYSVFEGETFG